VVLPGYSLDGQGIASVFEPSEGDRDLWTDTCSGGRENDFVVMLLLCDNVSEKYLWPVSFHYLFAIFILGVQRSSICYRMCFPVVSFILVLLRVLLFWSSYSLPLFTHSRDEHNIGDCRQCNVVDVR